MLYHTTNPFAIVGIIHISLFIGRCLAFILTNLCASSQSGSLAKSIIKHTSRVVNQNKAFLQAFMLLKTELSSNAAFSTVPLSFLLIGVDAFIVHATHTGIMCFLVQFTLFKKVNLTQL